MIDDGSTGESRAIRERVSGGASFACWIVRSSSSSMPWRRTSAESVSATPAKSNRELCRLLERQYLAAVTGVRRCGGRERGGTGRRRGDVAGVDDAR